LIKPGFTKYGISPDKCILPNKGLTSALIKVSGV